MNYIFPTVFFYSNDVDILRSLYKKLRSYNYTYKL